MIVLQNEIFMAKLSEFLLLSVRLAALFVAAPVLSASAISVPIRVALVMGISIVLMNVVPVPQVDLLGINGVLMIISEALIGITIGIIFQLAFSAIAIAGEHIALSMGLGFASMVDPQSGTQSPVVTQFLSIMLTLIFLAVGGHHIALQHLAASYKTMPIGSPFDMALPMGVVRAAALIFSAALIISVPVTRVAPQMNIFSIGFSITIMAGFTLLLVSIPSITNGMTGLIETVSTITRDLILTGRPQ
jgi:flagellar biosynthetic protein FliR